MTVTETDDIRTESPREIDTKLAQLYEAAGRALHRAGLFQQTLDGIARGRNYGPGAEERAKAGKAEALAKHDEAHSAMEPLNVEYKRRGRWSRFFLVTSSAGHVHSSMHCDTCNMRTEFAWLPELSGKSEEEAVQQYGDKMCTVCFPSAPAHPAFIRSAEERARAEAEKQATQCPAGPYDYETKRPGARYVRCSRCGHAASRHPSTGKMRKHKPAKERGRA